MGKFPFADEDSMQCAIVEIEEVRCDMNADFTEHLADRERFDEGQFWKQRHAFEKKWRDPDDVYIDVERREEERKEIGLPPRIIGNIPSHAGTLLHSQGTPLKVAQAQLGHSHMATTLDIYTHISGSAQRDAVNLLEEQLFPNVPKLESCENVSGTESQLVQ